MKRSVSLGPHAVLCVVGQSAPSNSKWLLEHLEADGVLRLDGCLVGHHMIVRLPAVQQSYRLADAMSVVLCMALWHKRQLSSQQLVLKGSFGGACYHVVYAM